MNRDKIFKVLTAALCTLALSFMLAFGFQTKTRAGFGDFNDYDSGGDYSSDYGGGYDYDSYDSDWDSDYSGDDSSLGTLSGIVYVIIILIIVVAANRQKINNRKKDTITRNAQSSKQKMLPDRTEQISNIIKEKDPLFTAPDFLSFARQVYMDIQTAWEKRDLEPVRAVLHQNLYQQTERQIQKKIADGIINHLERISINTAYLTSYRRDAQYEYLTIYLAASMIDYQVKEATGQVILGDKSTRWNMKYKMTFVRSNNSVTRSADEKEKGFVCPNCGAPLTGTSFGVCEYCGSTVTTGAYDWVLSGFGVVRDDTVDEGISY